MHELFALYSPKLPIINTPYTIASKCLTLKLYKMDKSKVWLFFKTINMTLKILLVVSILFITAITIFMCRINSGCCISLLNTVNALATSYVVAFVVFILTVELPLYNSRESQALIRKDMLNALNGDITTILNDMGVDKKFSKRSLMDTCQGNDGNFKQEEWITLTSKLDKISSAIIAIITSGLVLNDKEKNIISEVYRGASSLMSLTNMDFNDNKWDMVAGIIKKFDDYRKDIDIICSYIPISR